VIGVKYVAFLRGINVGGKNILPMKDLESIFEAAGAREVRTYIQSGNVVFEATDSLVKTIGVDVAKRIEKRFGLRVPVVVRSAKEMAKIAKSHPHLKQATNEKAVMVCFLLDRPGAIAIARLDPQRSPGDVFEVIGAEIYLHVPSGGAKTKLTNAYFDAKLQTVSTVRNWATVCKIVEIMGGGIKAANEPE